MTEALLLIIAIIFCLAAFIGLVLVCLKFKKEAEDFFKD